MQPERPQKRRYSLFSKTLKSCVEPVMRPVIKTQGAAASKLISQWPDIVGPEIASFSAPIKLQFPKDKNGNGTLTIACESAQALNLQHMVPVLIERLTMYFGYPAVTRIMLEQTLISRHVPEKPKAARKKTITVDTSCLDEITDPELKQALSDFAQELSRK